LDRTIAGDTERAHREQNGKETLKHLKKRCERESAPDIVINDRGTPFINEGVSAFFKEAGVEQKPTTSYNPMANGEAEAEVDNVKRELRVLLDGDPNWKKKLGEAAMHLDSSSDQILERAHTSKGFTNQCGS